MPKSKARPGASPKSPLTLAWRDGAPTGDDAEFRVDDVLSAFVHEARNALFGISATLEAFEADFSGNDLGAEYASMMHQPLKKLSRMMDELADYARPMGLELRVADATAIATEAIASARGLAQSQCVTVRLVLDHAEGPPVVVDPDRLGIALRSVLESAISRCRSGEEVELSVGRDEYEPDLLRYAVRDRGPELESGSGVRFEPAFTQKARGGTVFNLARAQRIALQHGGRIVAQNHNEGGVVVAIVVPVEAPRSPSSSGEG